MAFFPKNPVKLDIPHAWLRSTNWSGMSLSDAQLPFVNGTTGAAPSAAEITYIKNKGFNSVRLLVKQEVLQGNNSFASGLNKPYTEFASTPWSLFKAAVDSMTAQGIYVVLARHQGLDAQFGKAFGASITGNGGDNPATVLSDFWRRMVEGFGATNPMIGYSIDNEPLLGGGTGGWWDIAQDCINTIRKAGSGQCIFVPGISYSGASNWTSVPWNDPAPTGGVANSTKFLTLDDPCNNIIVELHCYFSTEDSGAVETNVHSGTIGRERLASAVSWASANNQRIFIGEFGSKAGITNSNANIIDYVSYCKSKSTALSAGPIVGMAWWTFGAYAFWNGYAYTLATQGSNPPTGTDSAQMTLLGTANFFSDPVVAPAFNPLTDLPNRYAYYNPSTASVTAGLVNSVADSSGLAADATKTLTAKTTGGFVKPAYLANDPNLNNLPSFSQTSAAGLAALLSGTFATPVSATSTYYLVYYVADQAPASTVYLRHRADNTTTLTNTHSLIHYFSFAGSTNGSSQVTRGSLTGMSNKAWIVAIVHNGASSKIYTNSLTAAATADTGSATSLSMGIGNAPSNPAKWTIGEHFIYSSAHSNTDVGTMMQYLATRYSITLT